MLAGRAALALFVIAVAGVSYLFGRWHMRKTLEQSLSVNAYTGAFGVSLVELDSHRAVPCSR